MANVLQMPTIRFNLEHALENTGGDWSGLSVCGAEFVAVDGEKVKWFGENERIITITGLERPCDVKVIGNEMYIYDMKKRAVIVSDRDGNVLRQLRLPEDDNLISLLGLAVNERENPRENDVYVSTLYIIRKTFKYFVYKCNNSEGNFQRFITEGLSQPWYMCTDADGNLYVSNNLSATVQKYDSQGTLLWTYGQEESSERHRLLEPRGVCTDNRGHIFIVDSRRGAIQVITGTGRFLTYVNNGYSINDPWAIGFGQDKLYVTTGQEKIYKIKVEYLDN